MLKTVFMKYGILGSGSWATALAKILTDNDQSINWWVRNEESIGHLQRRRHNPKYLSQAYFDPRKINLSSSINHVIEASDILIIAVPSAYLEDIFSPLNTDIFSDKYIVSAVKGLVPNQHMLLNEWLLKRFNVSATSYFAIVGPCHAEEVAAEKLSYLTISGTNEDLAGKIATDFGNEYIHTMTNTDITGVQYAAVLKNIYALGAGIAHGLEYGDNFISVYIANSANELVRFLRKINVGDHETLNYAASPYLGDLLVTCYSLYSRNRTFGNMIGKGYSVTSAKLELNMVAEGYNASRSIEIKNQSVKSEMPIAQNIYDILWSNLPAVKGFKNIEKVLT